ncbi:hypothetical protein AB0L40_24245 [Patulibacter sp. NPDC049589]|uniref:hypothetical protein n=1 Tax=Patulibacter sp. NPDC049589 TaxID=3154731 RepID=UPI00343922D7
MSAPDDRSPVVVRLDEQTIEQLAHRVADVLRETVPSTSETQPERKDAGRLLSAAQVAERWQIDREWVYAHAEELGALRLGTGPRPRLRFDPDTVRRHLRRPETPAAPRTRDRRRTPPIPGDHGALLPFQADPELSSNQPTDGRPSAPQAPPTRARRTRRSTR